MNVASQFDISVDCWLQCMGDLKFEIRGVCVEVDIHIIFVVLFAMYSCLNAFFRPLVTGVIETVVIL